MPILSPSGSLTSGYNLRYPFINIGGNYDQPTAESLRLWTRFRSSIADESGNSISTAYAAAPTLFYDNFIPNEKVARSKLPYYINNGGVSQYATAGPSALLNFGASPPTSISNKPFTISMWVRLRTSSAVTLFSMRSVSSTDQAMFASIETISHDPLVSRPKYAKITFLSYDANAGGSIGQGISVQTKFDPWGKNQTPAPWIHLTFTFLPNTSTPNLTYQNMKIYINGEEGVNRVTEASNAGYVGMDTDGTQTLYIGALNGSSAFYTGDLSEFCVWGKELVPDSINALYSSTRGRYERKSGIVSLPNRVRIREEDNLTGSYGSIARTTGVSGSKKGNKVLYYDDQRTILFKAQSTKSSLWPLVIEPEELKKGDTQSIIQSPSQIGNLVDWSRLPYRYGSDDLYVTSSAYLSTQGFRTYYNTGMENTPFNESRIFLGNDEDIFYVSGTSEKSYYGFSSPVRDKIAITIPMNIKSERIISRYSNRGVADADGLSPFKETTYRNSGFYYYNHRWGQWDGILPSTFSSYKMFYRSKSEVWNLGNADSVELGTTVEKESGGFVGCSDGNPVPIPQQFKMSDHTAVYIDSIADSTRTTSTDPYSLLTGSLGYHLVGAPTMAGLAPYHEIYHATSSNAIPLSAYITDPFILEKAVVDIPVIVQRMRGGNTGDSSTPIFRFHDSCRDIDNYMFFIYRQKNADGEEIDSAEDRVKSQRYLVCSGAASFVNSNALSGRLPEQVRLKGWPHSPAFVHDFLAPSGSYLGELNPPGIISAFTGTIRIEMTPAVGNGQMMGGSRFPAMGDTSLLLGGVRSVVTQDFWPGGTAGDPRINTGSARSSSTVTRPASGMHAPQINRDVFSCVGPQVTFAAGLTPFSAISKTISSSFRFDPSTIPEDRRSLGSPYGVRTSGYLGDIVNGTLTASGSTGQLGYTGKTYYFPAMAAISDGYPIGFGERPTSTLSPYVLLPGDNLVIGIDAGVGMLPSSGAKANDAAGSISMPQFINKGVDAGVDLGFTTASCESEEFFGCMSGSFMKILKGEAKITLFGSLIRENKEIMGESNQNLTTNAIHEAIGSERITDQFNIATSIQMSGTYVDNYVSGKMVSYDPDSGWSAVMPDINTEWSLMQYGRNFIGKGPLGSTAILNGSLVLGAIKHRRLIGNFSKNWSGLIQRSGSASDKSAYWGWYKDSPYSPPYPAGQSYIRNMSKNLKISLTDDPSKDVLAGAPFRWQPQGPYGSAGSGDVENNLITHDPFSVSAQLSTVEGDGGHRSLQRFVRHINETERYYDSMAPDIKDFAARSQGIAYVVSDTQPIPLISVFPARIQGWPYQGNPPRYVSEFFNARIYGTSGLALQPMSPSYYTFSSKKDYKLVYTSIFQRGYDYASRITKSGVAVRWKHPASGAHGPLYGMISPVSKQTSAVYRMDRYGQLRDMLEQRKYGKFYVNVGGKNASVLDSPIQVRFVDERDGVTIVNPYQTDSSNMSYEYTSSMAYSDGNSILPPSPLSRGEITFPGMFGTFSSTPAASAVPVPYAPSAGALGSFIPVYPGTVSAAPSSATTTLTLGPMTPATTVTP